MIAPSNEFGENPVKIPRDSAIIPRYFVKSKGKNMNKTHEFYPMISGTLKSLLNIAEAKHHSEILQILTTYPNCLIDDNNALFKAIQTELDRQYSRWNKGGING